MVDAQDLDTGKIREWRSIVTLIVFVLTNLAVIFPFHVPIWIPKQIWNGSRGLLSRLKIITKRGGDDCNGSVFKRLRFPIDLITAPLIADLFLLAILAIGRQEVHDGTIGANHIVPYDIMIFFLSLAYIAISVDASGLLRYLAYRVLKLGGDVGHRLFFYLYIFFFGLGSFIGNDPIILSGTAFLAYMTRVSSNIKHPTAWIFSQFSVANIASAILVSSNPTNLVLAGAFDIKFLHYTANIIVPVLFTVIFLFPFLMYIVFNDDQLIPSSIKLHELPEEAKAQKPINPNIPNARGKAGEEEATETDSEAVQILDLQEIMHPFIDKRGAIFGASVMAATLIAILALNAAAQSTGQYPVFYVTLPAAVVVFSWDMFWGWMRRHETRWIARKGRQEVDFVRTYAAIIQETPDIVPAEKEEPGRGSGNEKEPQPLTQAPTAQTYSDRKLGSMDERLDMELEKLMSQVRSADIRERISIEMIRLREKEPPTLASKLRQLDRWSQETFPTAMAVLAHLPFPLVPFSFCMFVLVQALVTKGWVPVFAHGWDHWVNKTGTVGSIAGMGFLSTVLCNFAGTNIGTTILLSRIIQAWQQIHQVNGTTITNRTFWGTIYSMALGVNYGAFSAAFSGSLAGLLWRDILARKHIHVSGLQFARQNLPIIAISMTVGCVALVAQIYIIRDNSSYDAT